MLRAVDGGWAGITSPPPPISIQELADRDITDALHPLFAQRMDDSIEMKILG